MKSSIMKKLTQSTFDSLVDQALELYREQAAASSQFGDARDEKLSAKGYMAEALKNARCDLSTIQKLDRAVLGLPEDAYRNLLRFVAQVTKQAAATRGDQGCNLRPVTGNLHYFVGCDQSAFTGVLVEATTIGSTVLQLVALAALRATRDHPDNFGSIDDWDKHHAAQEERQAQFAALCARIAQEWRQADIEITDVGADGRALITIRIGEAAVPLGDPETLGQRLCEALV